MCDQRDQHRKLLLDFTIGSFGILLDDVPISSWEFFLHGIVGGITGAISQTTPRTGGRIIIRLSNNLAVRIIAFSSLLTLVAFAGLGFGLLLTRSFLAGLSRAALLAVGTAFLFFFLLDQLRQHIDDFILFRLSHFVGFDQLKSPA